MTLHVAPSLNRRHFLAGSAALGMAAGLSPGGFIDPAEARAIAIRVSRADWDNLAGDLVGPLLRPKDTPFVRFAAPYNLAYNTPDRMPMAIAMCANTADVVTAVRWAAKNKVPLVARAGGHSYAGFSMTGGLMIDVSTVRGNYWNKPDEITFGAGARNADLYKILSAANRTVTHGRCPTVGAAGFLLGGGIGFNMRLHGVASDHLAASEIVTADGKVLQLSENENADLFWACRGGGGGNFGINTSFTLKTVAPKKVTFFKASWSGDRKVMANVAFQLMKSLTGAENELGSRFALTAPNPIGQNKQYGVNIIGQYQSDDDKTKRVEELLGPALSAVKECKKVDTWPDNPGACQYQIVFMDYWKAQTEGKYLLDTDKPFAFHERSAFVTEALGLDVFERAAEIMKGWQGSSDFGGPAFNADFRFFQTGGAVNDMPADKTAFVHRDSKWLMDIGLPWSAMDTKARVEANVRWQNDFFEEMWKLPACNKHAYQNFADPALANFAEAYYGTNLKKLRDIKGAIDPDGLFTFPQAIPA